MVHAVALAAGGVVAGWYYVASSALQLLYYRRRGDDPKDVARWKLQPSREEGLAAARGCPLPRIPLLGLLGLLPPRPDQPGDHFLLCTINVAVAALFAVTAAEAALRGASALDFGPAPASRVFTDALWLLLAHQMEEYWWHRLMHLPFFYARCHKLHHANRSPAPFDDMYIHPLEAAGYYTILYSPPFVGVALGGLLRAVLPAGVAGAALAALPTAFTAPSLGGFAAYMAVVGVAGITDHSGE
jgi:hypothetical protein